MLPVSLNPTDSDTLPDYVIDHVLPRRSVLLFCGPSRHHKTACLAYLGTCLRDGVSFCGHSTTPQQLGIILLNRSWDDDGAIAFGRVGWTDIPHVTLDDDTPDWNTFRRRDGRYQWFRRALDRLKLPPHQSTVFVDYGDLIFLNRRTDRLPDGLRVGQEIREFAALLDHEYGLTGVVTALPIWRPHALHTCEYMDIREVAAQPLRIRLQLQTWTWGPTDDLRQERHFFTRDQTGQLRPLS